MENNTEKIETGNEKEGASEKMSLPSVYDYLDYREYLKDFYKAKKEGNSGYSYKVFASLAGFSSPSQILMVMQGKRSITIRSIGQFAKALKLGKRERKYFEDLVHLNQADDPEMKKHYYERLIFKHNKNNGRVITDKEYTYLANWYIPVIREMVGQKGFSLDPVWIARKLKNRITPIEARNALKLLLDLSLIEKDDDGSWRVTEVNVVSPNTVSDILTYQFHSQMIELAKSTLKDDGKTTKKSMSSLTAALSERQLTRIQQYLHDFRDRVLYELKNPGDEKKEIYQLNIHLFSLTKVEGGIA